VALLAAETRTKRLKKSVGSSIFALIENLKWSKKNPPIKGRIDSFILLVLNFKNKSLEYLPVLDLVYLS
jgi:hypothetical protein